MLFRNLLRLLSDERPRLGWWSVLVVLSVGFAILELTGSLAILMTTAVIRRAVAPVSPEPRTIRSSSTPRASFFE